MAGGGIGEAALIGAAFGGGRALMTGEDPLKAALLGGVTGGAMAGVTSAIPGMDKLVGGAGGTSGATTGTVAKDITTNAVSPTALGSNISSGYLPDAQSLVSNPMLVNAGEGVGSVVSTNVADGVMPAVTNAGGISSLQGVGTNVADPGINSLVNNAVKPNALGENVIQSYLPKAVEGIDQFAVNNVNPIASAIDRAVPATPPSPFVALKQAINPEAGGMIDKGLNFAIANPNMTAAGAGAAYGAYQQSQIKPEDSDDKKKEEKSPLAGYDRESYIPYEAPRPDPYPQAQYVDYFNYAKEGGVMKSYAEGGIAALANGGMGGNLNFPQGRLDQTQYATPTQMPTSAEVVNAGYEPKTDPYSGSPIGMAEGGVARFFSGGGWNLAGNSKDDGSVVRYDSSTGQYYTVAPKSNTGWSTVMNPIFSRMPNYEAASRDPNSPFWNGRVYITDPFARQQQQQAAPAQTEIYRPSYNQQVPVQSYSGPQGGMAPNYSLANSMPLLAKTNPAAAQAVSGMAEGGIAGYNLGGYAAGGNPRLLKGPGDGMSDNIPATIGDRQPARLADGEFVVPADVVSHLGNGSTDAGAKHLYSMMDKVRKARTGSKKQGKQIKPAKFMPA